MIIPPFDKVDSVSRKASSSTTEKSALTSRNLVTCQVAMPIFDNKAKEIKPSPSLAARCWKNLTGFFSAIGIRISQACQEFYRKIFGSKDTTESQKDLQTPNLEKLHRQFVADLGLSDFEMQPSASQTHRKLENDGILDPAEFNAAKPIAPVADIQSAEVSSVIPPNGITNIGNSCFRISIEQAIKACEPLKRTFAKNFNERLNHYSDETEVQFNDRVATARKAYSQLKIMMENLQKGSSDEILADQEKWQKILFQGKWEPTWWNLAVNGGRSHEVGALASEFSPRNHLAQMDAFQYLELILGLADPKAMGSTRQITRESTDHLANCGTENERHAEIERAREAGTLYSSKGAVEERVVLPIALGKPGTSLQELVDKAFSPTLGPKMKFERRVVDKDEDGKKTVRTKVKECPSVIATQQYVGEPKDFLVLQIGRTTEFGGPHSPINRTAVPVPRGVVDLSLGYPGQGRVLYSATSFVCHVGVSINSGHYISYVKKEGQWFLCNDNTVQSQTETEAMEAMEQAYIMFFERV